MKVDNGSRYRGAAELPRKSRSGKLFAQAHARYP